MKFRLFVFLLLSLTYSLVAQNVSDKDAQFLKDFGDEGMLQVRLGEMAKVYAKALEVKTLGGVLVKDHSKLIVRFKTFADSNNVALPEMLTEKSQKLIDKLAAKKGKDFDALYCSIVVKNHKADLEKLNSYYKKTKSENIKKLITTTIEQIEQGKKLCIETQKKL